jgi:Zn-finger nucleic acid-binding protein
MFRPERMMSYTATAVSEQSAINCPQCGGTVTSEKSVAGTGGLQHPECRFCSTVVRDTSSPLSIDRLTALGETLDVVCPCCHQALQAGMIDEHPDLYCASCYGLLMKHTHFGAALRERRARRNGAESEDPRPIDLRQYERTISCPGCDRPMETHPYYGPGNVVIDSCSGCSYLWLDHSELTRLERASGRNTDSQQSSERGIMSVSADKGTDDCDSLPSTVCLLADWLFL